MFTGLIEEVGKIESFSRGTVNHITVSCAKIAKMSEIGDSVAVNGVCLTVTAVGTNKLTFDAVSETISRSTLGSSKAPDKVNLETSLKAGKAIGGHFVLGHVDGVGSVSAVESIGESKVIRFNAPVTVTKYIVEKGSIAIDGISLTVASSESNVFSISIIPHTLGTTTLELKKVGDKVNLEADIIGKYVEKFVKPGSISGVTDDLLKKAGFM